MRDCHAYDYAVIRVVPQVEREEFINVGVILSCPALKYLGTRIHLDAARLQAFAPASTRNWCGAISRRSRPSAAAAPTPAPSASCRPGSGSTGSWRHAAP